jgi:hypothetical protein
LAPAVRRLSLAAATMACRPCTATSLIGRSAVGAPGQGRPVKVKYWLPQNISTPMSLLLAVSVVPRPMTWQPLPLGENSV